MLTHVQLFRERLSEKMCTRQSRKEGNMGYDRYTVPDDCSCPTYFSCFPLALANTFSWSFVPIPSNFFEEQKTQNHPQCLSGLSRALFPTTFLEIAVYALLTYGNMPVQPRLRVKILLKFKYENIVWLAFQKNLYSKTRLDGHITIREKRVLALTRRTINSNVT